MSGSAKTEPVIKIKNLGKVYKRGTAPAVNDLSIEVYGGEVYGFLGPNGAGKSTTIRMLLNFIQPTSGSASIKGYDVVKDSLEIRKSIGYLSGDFAIYPKMTGRQFLQYMCDLQSIDFGQNITQLARRLNANLDKKLSELSRGNRQKIGLIQAFMHQPAIIILDEPTSGLDPLVQETFHELTQEAKNRGACVFMSSHVLGEVQKICDRVGIIREGKLVSENNIAEMAMEATQTFDITFAKSVPVDKLQKIRGLKLISRTKDRVTIHVQGSLNELFGVLSENDVTAIDTRTLDLEEEFMRFYENKEND